MGPGIVLIDIDRQYLLDNQLILQRLCDLYCSIWETDENFGEYRKCPVCGTYFSHEQVEVRGVDKCETCNVGLVPAWLPVSVALNLLQDANEYPFIGKLLLHEDEIIGFSWGVIYTIPQLTKHINDAANSLLTKNKEASHCFYLKELAIKPGFRGLGLGSGLVRTLLKEVFYEYPEALGALSTHQSSPSVPIYIKLGFWKLADVGQGRIRMGIAYLSNAKL